MYLGEVRHILRNSERKDKTDLEAFMNTFDSLDEQDKRAIQGIYNKLIKTQKIGPLIAIEIIQAFVKKQAAIDGYSMNKV